MESVRLEKYRVYFENRREFRELAREIFTEQVYYVEVDKKEPVIVDVGAHIGLASLYFKKVYPGAKIVAVEPNPKVLPLLYKNLYENVIEGVEVVSVAVAAEEGKRDFYVDPGSWQSSAGRWPRAWNGLQELERIEVEEVRLEEVLPERVDLLKLDIEGVETEVLAANGEALARAEKIVMEFHQRGRGAKGALEETLEKVGFEVKAWVESRRKKGLAIVEAWKRVT